MKKRNYLNQWLNKFRKSKKELIIDSDQHKEEEEKVEINNPPPENFTPPIQEEILPQSRLEFIGIFKNSPKALVYTDLEGYILEVNNKLEKLLEYSPEELRGKKIFQFFIDYPGQFLDALQNHHNIEATVKKRNNKTICVSLSSSVNQVKGKIIGKIWLLDDITNRKVNENINNVLYSISRLANSDIPLYKFYTLIRREISTVVDTTNFYITLFNEEENQLYFSFYADETGERDEDFFISRPDLSDSIFGYIFKKGESLLLNYRDYKKMVDQGDFVSRDVITNKQAWLGVPLKVENKSIGSMVLRSYTNPNIYSYKDVKLMEFVSQQIATVIVRRQAEEKIKFFNLYRCLSGLPDRGLVYEKIKEEIFRAKEGKYRFLILFMNINGFKEAINRFEDQQDNLLSQEVARRLNTLLRKTDQLCRYSENDFIILLSPLNQSREKTIDLVQKICSSLIKPIFIKNNQINLTTNIGIALFPEDGEKEEVLLQRAEQGKYGSKQKEKNEQVK